MEARKSKDPAAESSKMKLNVFITDHNLENMQIVVYIDVRQHFVFIILDAKSVVMDGKQIQAFIPPEKS